jgi:signal transduction histidine kinase
MTTPGPPSSVRAVRRIRVDLQRLDYIVAALATAWLFGEAQHDPGAADHHQLLVPLLWTPVTVAIALRRRHPAIAGWVAIASSGIIQSWWSSSLLSGGVGWICDMYAFAVWTERTTFVVGLVAWWAAIYVLGPIAGDFNVKNATSFMLIATVVILLVRLGIRGRDRRADLAEREREVAAREAVVDERARIARELHDAIAHNVSMMVVQAGAERRVLDDTQGSTREVLETVEEIGRNALTEMRRLVGMLRTDDESPLAPQPGLDDLPTLVGQVREAGLPVELHVEGERRELPVGLELSAYRIVQEALTNALKHAGDARASVRVRYGDDSLELEVVDDGAGAQAELASGGHGLVGMRERVALYGGRFEAGRHAAGGFTVRVLLPIR